jgi:OFA family oxalate/formate antiporter-like MFS transporter
LKWFKDRRGLASGIIAAGFGGGTALFIPIISSTIASGGYQKAFIATGIFQGLVIVLVAQFLRHPETGGAKAAAVVRTGTERRQFTTLEMLRTPQFYQMYVMFVMMSTGGLLVTANAGPMSQSWGLTAAALTLATTLSPVANGSSRVFWGWVSDRLGRENTMVLAFVLQAICLVLVVLLGRLSGGLFALTLVLVYFTWGEIYSLFPSTVGDYFGTRHATSNYSVLYTAKGVASIIGGWFGAFLFERTGSWSGGFYGSALMALIAAGLALSLRPSAVHADAPVGVPATAK